MTHAAKINPLRAKETFVLWLYVQFLEISSPRDWSTSTPSYKDLRDSNSASVVVVPHNLLLRLIRSCKDTVETVNALFHWYYLNACHILSLMCFL